MTLFEKILAIYPELTPEGNVNFFRDGTIVLQNDSDGKGDYIKEWNHLTLSQPTAKQLA